MWYKVNIVIVLMFSQIHSVPVEILDDEKTGPQPSIVGSIDKVLKNVNKMDQYQCLQKMICEFMGQAEDLAQDTVVSAVNSQLGPQAGQVAQSSLSSFQNNPSQFAQQIQSPNGPIIQAVTAQLDNTNSNLSPTNQIIQSLGSQFIQQAFQQRPTQNQFQTQFGQQQFPQQQFVNQQQQFQGQQQFQQFPQQQFVPQGQQQFQQFPQQQFVPQGQQQFQQFPQQQFVPQGQQQIQQFPQQQFVQQQQFQQFPQQQFVPQGQQQFQQFPQQQQFQQFPNKQFAGQQQQQTQSSGGFLEGIADSIAGNIAGGLASSFAGNLLSNVLSSASRRNSAQSRSDVAEGELQDIELMMNRIEEESLDEFKPSKLDNHSREKRQSSTHGQAIRVMQSLGFDNMGVYPFVRAAIIGHANRAAPTNCKQLFRDCPDTSDQLLNYLNNHNGGLFQNAIPSATDEVSSLFPGLPSIPGLPSLPQVAASTLETFSNSNGASSSNSAGNIAGSLVQAESGILSNLVDGLAGMIAGRFS